MTARATKVGDFLDNLKANLDIRLAALAVTLDDATLAEVVVSTAGLRIDEAFESIEFDSATIETDWAAIGNRPREERTTVTGLVWVVKPGAGEETIKAARDRAILLLDVLAQELRANFGQWRTSQQADSAVRKSALKSLELTQGALESGRIARIAFTIDYDDRLPS
jgi:hypothetical protein